MSYYKYTVMTENANLFSAIDPTEEPAIAAVAVSKLCPLCKLRLVDRMSNCTGIIRVKCPRCRNEVYLDLALRIAI